MRFVRRISALVVTGFIAGLSAGLMTGLIVGGERPAFACSTFSTPAAGGFLVAKNFDWPSGEGWIVANERGRQRSKLIPGGLPAIASWSSRYASVSFTTVGPGFPIGGMNEVGLTIESLVDASVTPSITPDPARLTGLELVQYGLDHFENVDDLADFAERSGVSQLAIALHFFACDRRGACVVLESRNDGMHAVRGADLGVHALANRPFRIDAQTPAKGSTPGDRPSSGARFAAMAAGLGAEPPHDVNEAFRLLDTVRIPSFTKWQIVWDAHDARVHFRDRPGAAVSSLRTDVANVACNGAPRVRPILPVPILPVTAGRGDRNEAPPFAPWSEADAARAERGVVAQVGARSAAARQLASAVAAATRATTCARTE